MLSRHDCWGQAWYQIDRLRESLVSVKDQLEERKLVLRESMISVSSPLVFFPVFGGFLLLSDSHLSLEQYLILLVPILHICILNWTWKE